MRRQMVAKGPQERRRPATLKAIACQTGVSIGTVSRILRGQGHVVPEKRKRVLERARHLGYRPNLLVQGLQSGRTRNVGVLMPFRDAFYCGILSGIHDELVAHDYAPILLECHTTPDGGFSGKSELELIHELVDRRVDAVIMVPSRDAATDAYLREMRERALPVVAVDRELPWAHADFVGTDDEAGGRLAAEVLLQRGHRLLGHVAGPSYTSTGRLRRQGFEAAVREAGGACVTCESPDFVTAYEPTVQMLSRRRAPTAIFASNDILAREVYRAAARVGRTIPGDLAVLGFGNLDFAVWMTPALSTFEQPIYAMGRKAASLALERVDSRMDGTAARKIRLAARLTARESVQMPPARATGTFGME